MAERGSVLHGSAWRADNRDRDSISRENPMARRVDDALSQRTRMGNWRWSPRESSGVPSYRKADRAIHALAISRRSDTATPARRTDSRAELVTRAFRLHCT